MSAVSPPALSAVPAVRTRLRAAVQGAVQGVGFRPFVYQLAGDLSLAGWVRNTPCGVLLEVEGERPALNEFVRRLQTEAPPSARIRKLETSVLAPAGYEGFEIRASDGAGPRTALVLPDIATCAGCLREIFTPGERRHLYPFTNCAHCGPRFTILLALPYDRANTVMRRFAMCASCRAEYEDPRDRRFHAQPIACPTCGPQLELWDSSGQALAHGHEALLWAAAMLREGAIVAAKGVGGFHLLTDARSEEVVCRLRRRKSRDSKPLALMAPSMEWIRAHCRLSHAEENLLRSPEAPIVLLRRASGSCSLAPGIAPGVNLLGVMLPYTPLHHVLVRELGFPVVATSGNRAEEPLCTEEQEALERLGEIADFFLVHDRPIARPVDDSVARLIAGRPVLFRRARGYAPLPVEVAHPLPPVVAAGAHQKNVAALSCGRDVFLTQHVGNLDTALACEALPRALDALRDLYGLAPQSVTCDLHPDYASTRFAAALAAQAALPLRQVQHHHAHVLSCLADNGAGGSALGVAWDGTGYGGDGTVWGGEFLRIDGAGWERAAYLRRFRLPGGERAVREPRRAAIGLLAELYGDDLPDVAPVRAFVPRDLEVLRGMIVRGISAPLTSSAGRLFDAVAALLDLCQRAGYEGEAALRLECALEDGASAGSYPFELVDDGAGAVVGDWGPAVRELLSEIRSGTAVGAMAARFHNTLAEVIVAVARRVGEEQVALTGGCFQNRYLTERTEMRLREAGLRPLWHQRVPPNDGGIALGQAVASGLVDRQARG